MTRGTIKDEIAALRFDTSTARVNQIYNWLSAAEISIWNADDWIFKRVVAANMAVTSGSRLPAMPTDFNRAIRVFDNNGLRMDYREPDLFEELYPAATTGTPEAYTVINRVIYLGPTPNASVTFKVSYERVYTHLAAAVTPTAGLMNSDDDAPIWDVGFHYILVFEAALIGGQLLDDVTLEPIQRRRDEMLAAMRANLVVGAKGEVYPQPRERQAVVPTPDPGASRL